jgi:hypothetical protein
MAEVKDKAQENKGFQDEHQENIIGFNLVSFDQKWDGRFCSAGILEEQNRVGVDLP